jgi:hypothetical protein
VRSPEMCALDTPARLGRCTRPSVHGPPGRRSAARADRVRRKVGVDCPFGWPQPFVNAVAAHAEAAI